MPNPTLEWHGTAARCRASDQRFLLRVGDCSWQDIPHGHTWGTPGYPRLVMEALMQTSIALRFANYHAGLASELPDEESLDRVCNGSRPDAILVQFGGYYAARGLVSNKVLEPYELRTWFNWVSGSFGGALHRRVSRPLLRRWGQHRVPAASALDASNELREFLSNLQARFPAVPVAFIPPQFAYVDAAVDPARLDDAAHALVTGARAAATEIIDLRPDLAAAAARGICLFGANGYDLRRPAHEIVARRILHWLEAKWSLAAESRHRLGTPPYPIAL